MTFGLALKASKIALIFGKTPEQPEYEISALYKFV